MDLHIAGYPTIDKYVNAKIERFEAMPKTFESLFELMFSEAGNIFYEKTEDYRIKKTTYGEAKADIIKLGSVLKKFKAQPGDVVGIYMENSLLWIEVFWAVLSAGYRPLLMNLRLDDATLEEALATAKASLVISDKKCFSIATVLTSEITSGFGGKGGPGSFAKNTMFASVNELASAGEVDAQNKKETENFAQDNPPSTDFGTEIIVMTSGTSEHIKLCAYDAETFFLLTKNSAEIIKKSKQIKTHYNGAIKQLCFLPFYHVFGLIAVYIWFAFFSRTFVELPSLAPQTLLSTVKRHEVTHIFAVPLFWDTIYESALRTIKSRGEATYKKFQKGMAISRKIGDWPIIGKLFAKKAFVEIRENIFGDSIVFMISGGSYIRPEVMEFFNAIGYRLADGYGMSEIGITSVELSDKKKLLNSCSVGEPFSTAKYKINETGELLVSGDALAKYILCDGEKREISGWFETGDLAKEVDGHYYILGRKDDLLIGPSGENINPNIVEERLTTEGINGLCLIEGERKVPTLIVSLEDATARITISDIKTRLAEKIKSSGYETAIGKVVYTSTGLLLPDEIKLNRKRIKKAYEAGELELINDVRTSRDAKDVASTGASAEASTDGNPAKDDSLDTALTAILADAFKKALSRNDAPAFTSDFFINEGGDSLSYIAMLDEISDATGVSLPPEDGRSLTTQRAFYDYIKETKKDVV